MQVALEGGSSDAGLEAISRTAKHRLNRGIWTSPGAGQLLRRSAASICILYTYQSMLCGDIQARNRSEIVSTVAHRVVTIA